MKMVNNVFGTFISQKIHKVRWIPNDVCDSVVTGSWDDHENKLSLWKYYKVEDGDNFFKPKLLHSIEHDGNIMEMKFFDESTLAISSSIGSIHLFRITEKDGESLFTVIRSWQNIHSYSNGETASGTDVACFEDTIISVGEDGRIVLISITENQPYRVVEDGDSCTIRCVSVSKFDEVLTGNSRGQMKVWDLRNYSSMPQTCFTLTGIGQVGFTRVVSHPTQTHIKFAGGEDGTITVWDLRNNKLAVNSLNAHAQSVNELMFHPDRPEHLYSCSSNGQLWHWDSSTLSRIHPLQFTSSSGDDFKDTDCPWLSKNLKNRVTVYSIIQNLHLPINSLDVRGNLIVCGCDNEAVYLINDICTH